MRLLIEAEGAVGRGVGLVYQGVMMLPIRRRPGGVGAVSVEVDRGLRKRTRGCVLLLQKGRNGGLELLTPSTERERF